MRTIRDLGIVFDPLLKIDEHTGTVHSIVNLDSENFFQRSHCTSTRQNALKFYPPPRTKIGEMSFVNKSIKLRNSLPDSSVTACTVPSSKAELVNTSFYNDVYCKPYVYHRFLLNIPAVATFDFLIFILYVMLTSYWMNK